MTPAERISALVAEVEDLSAQIEADGMMTYGSKGQPVLHPAIAARHAAIALLQKLEAAAPPDDGPSALESFLSS